MSVGDSLNAFCRIGGDEVGMSMGCTLHGRLRSSILVAKHSAVPMIISLICFFCSSFKLGLMSLSFLSRASWSFLARHSMPFTGRRCKRLCCCRKGLSSSLLNSSYFPGSKVVVPSEVGLFLGGMAELISWQLANSFSEASSTVWASSWIAAFLIRTAPS